MRNTPKPKHSRLKKLRVTWAKQLKIQWEEDAYYSRTVTSFCYALWVRLEHRLKPMRVHATNLSLISFILVVGAYILFPTIANADIELGVFSRDEETVSLLVESMQNETEDYGRLPTAQDADPRDTFTIPITAYTSDPAQTDDTPCITASGLDVCEHGVENVVAANFLPIGTRVRIPELYGDRVFYVEDRMNERYYYKMDIWMEELSDAKSFGVKSATVEVF
jgi:3D (Asp-Asp-Asp) domain-containing protein